MTSRKKIYHMMKCRKTFQRWNRSMFQKKRKNRFTGMILLQRQSGSRNGRHGWNKSRIRNELLNVLKRLIHENEFRILKSIGVEESLKSSTLQKTWHAIYLERQIRY